MPRFSSSLMSPASVYREGGCVCFASECISMSVSVSLITTFGNSTSSPRAAGSALSQPSKRVREPFATKFGMSPPMTLVTIFVLRSFASVICEATVRPQISAYRRCCSSVVPARTAATLVGRIASCASCADLLVVLYTRGVAYSCPNFCFTRLSICCCAPILIAVESVRM